MKVVLVGLLFLCVMAIHSETTTIKLCGREFVRAIVFACGGSRWRRQLGDPFSEGLIDANGNYMEKSKSQSNELIQYYMESEKDLQDMQQKSVHKRSKDVVELTITCCTIGCSANTINSLC
ncbi:insulin-like peptide INSL5 [Pantherophis guttatus]|uniref:Insulin-like peptide INSL5 n=1 Tax=Pantherophis guttatus TaxID=94885 RepID=A0A6P9D0R9_PANGU|nr:insulin-like peptide INSL5 [Pantherophis guttatus]